MGKTLERLVGILGKRSFLSFGLVTFLVASLLATVNLASRHALKVYVEDQLQRIPWDVTMYEAGGTHISPGPSLSDKVREVTGVQRVESLVFLRAILPPDVAPKVDGNPMSTPWLCMMAATDASLLPPQLRMAIANVSGKDNTAVGAVLGLVGPERSMGKAFFALQGAREFSLDVQVGDNRRNLFSTPVHGAIRLDRDEMNRWLMDQTGSISFIPYIGAILLMPYRAEVLNRFDSVANGMVPSELLTPQEANYGHVKEAEYFPEIIYLARVDRARLVSGWDIAGSMQRVTEMRDRVAEAAQGGASIHVESTTLVLLERMNGIARLIGVLTLLIALPLLWMAWVLAANLCGLLMLNERRTLGLMRLRGVPGHILGRAFLLAISSGGLLGGVLGLAAGSLVPLMIYESGALPLSILAERQQIFLYLGFLIITVGLALLTSRRLVRYATSISPLEASGRVAASEALHATVSFGVFQLLALLLGAYTLAGWVTGWELSAKYPRPWLLWTDRLLGFVGLPLFLYGTASLLVSQRTWIQRLLAPVIRPIAGRLGSFALHHVATKPHRTIGFLLIVALMVSVCLYPTVTSRSFEDKAVRGARVQMGSEYMFTFNSPDLADASKLQRGLGNQLDALRPGIARLIAALEKVPGVRSTNTVVEAILPNFYLPGYGFRGVPLYLLGDVDAFSDQVYSEPALGITGHFKDLLANLKNNEVAVSPAVSDFWKLHAGSTVLIGMDEQRRSITAPSSGTMGFLPGTPPRSVTDRQGYVQARVDYMNYLFSSTAYVVASLGNTRLTNLQALVPRVIVLVDADPNGEVAATQTALLHAMTVAPMEAHNLPEEVHKVGSDMFIALAMENMRIYLVGGLLLALIAILAVSMANYTEDHRTFALLRIRGASPEHIRRFLMAMLLSPALLGLVLGGLVALLAGFGLTNYVWKLRELKTVVQLLPTRLVISLLTLGIAAVLMILLLGVSWLFSVWVFRRTARETMLEG